MSNFKVQMSKILLLILVICCLLIVASYTEAAVLYLEPASGEYQPGDSFMVAVKIDTEGECINTIEANLNFSQEVFQAIDFSKGESIITLWVKPPTIEQDSGLISFSGGIPGGYCGRVPGDPGISNIVGEIIFRVVSRAVPRSSAQVVFQDDSQVFLNDGLGTKANLSTQGAVFDIVGVSGLIKDEWKKELEKDEILPEPFEIEIHKEEIVFNNKYFITFLTTDKQTGLDHFEIKEGKGGWIIRDSPYLLQDQNLRGIIKVKAVDKAGNERVAEYTPPALREAFPLWGVVVVVIGIGVVLWIIKRFRLKK